MPPPSSDPTAGPGRVAVLGAGPAGLAASLALARRGATPVLYERAATVGGICRTLSYQGYYFDLGGHRFFTKFDEVQRLWEEVLPDDLLLRPRMSRIYYGGDFYDYPLRATNALRNLGAVESARCMASYLRARLRPNRVEESFEDWVSNRFGNRLFDIFFRTYTEKVWGIPTSQIGAEWAAQRIKNLSLGTAVKSALPRRLARVLPGSNETVTSLIEQFHYPRRGPGQMYDAMQVLAAEAGADIRTRHEVVGLLREGHRVTHVEVRNADGVHTEPADQVLSSIPLTVLVRSLRPAAPSEVLAAVDRLRYRHLLTVDLIVDHPDLFPDNWIYVHDPALKLGRIQNFKNWSPEMVPDPSRTSLGLEYFCSTGDSLWEASDEELLAIGTRELEETGLLRGAKVLDGTVFRVPRAYPVYERGYEAHLDCIVDFVKGLDNVQPMGRYGMFKYNNSDHSILTALLAVENLHGARHDLWAVNTDSDYQEIRQNG